MEKPSNLYSIQLRPRIQDTQSRVVNPVFSINRNNDDEGPPLSALYNAMYATYPHAEITLFAPQEQLGKAVLATIDQPVCFSGIQT